MKQSLARTFITVSLILSLTSFILSLIAFYLPNWKYIQLNSAFKPIVLSDNNPMDPLIRGEIDKYTDVLYHRGETHSFGLSTHCVIGSECGRNYLPTFHETDYGLCHNINSHRQCIFSNSLLTTNEPKCTCEQPSYVRIIHKLLIFLIILQILFAIVNILRLCRHHCTKYCLNDIYLRLISLLSSLFSLIFLIIIIIQYNGNRLTEPLEFFESMRRHYSRIQIYTFSKDLELIIEQIKKSLDIRDGSSYICILIILISTIISFLSSITVEVKISSTSSSLIFNNNDNNNNNNIMNNDDNEKKSYRYQNHNNHVSREATTTDRFVPSEQIRFTRQTKV